jgi:hypothetical protein
MKGRNTIIFNQAALNKAVEFYLKEKVFKEDNFEVTTVTVDKGVPSSNTFKIDLLDTSQVKPVAENRK